MVPIIISNIITTTIGPACLSVPLFPPHILSTTKSISCRGYAAPNRQQPRPGVHRKSNRSDFRRSELVSALRKAGNRLHVLAADALASSSAEVERLRNRVAQLEAIARLNGETIQNMQRVAAETEREQFRSVTR